MRGNEDLVCQLSILEDVVRWLDILDGGQILQIQCDFHSLLVD